MYLRFFLYSFRSTLTIGARYSYVGEEATLNLYEIDGTPIATYPLPAIQSGSINVDLQVAFDYELVVVEIVVPVSACNTLVDMRIGILQVKHTCSVDDIECPMGVDVCGTCGGLVVDPEVCDDGTLSFSLCHPFLIPFCLLFSDSLFLRDGESKSIKGSRKETVYAPRNPL